MSDVYAQHRRRRVRTKALTLLLVLVLCAGAALTLRGADREVLRVMPSEGLGSYGVPVMAKNGRIDIEGTVSALQSVGANRYYYLIPDRQHLAERRDTSAPQHLRQGDWEDLPRFAEVAAEADIEIVVYLVPPLQSGAATYLPYGWDYDGWFRAIGKVASLHKNIVGIALDDFGSATDLRANDGTHPRFSPKDVAALRRTARSEAHWLRLYAVMYGQDFAGNTATYPRFRNVIDGVIYAFAGPNQLQHAPQNTTDARGVVETTTFIRDVSSCHSGGACWQVAFPASARGPGSAGSAQISKTVEVPPGSAPISLSFSDNAPPGLPRRYSIELALDGHSLETSRAQIGNRSKLLASVPASLQGERRTLSLRVYRSADPNGVAVTIDQLAISGTLIDTKEWTPANSGVASIEVVSRTPLIGMFYTSRLGIEEDRVGAADEAYVREVATAMRRLIHQGELDGLVAYRLNFSSARSNPLVGDPRNRFVVREVYESLHDQLP